MRSKQQASSEAEPAGDPAQAIFDALCRVQSAQKANDGPEAAISLFARAIGQPGKDAQAEDDFPDFSKAPPFPAPVDIDPLPGPVSKETPSLGDTDKDALLRGLLRALGEYQALLGRYNRDFDEALSRRSHGEPEDQDATLKRLRDAQLLLVKYPIASQAAFAALVREGRRFAGTDEGQEWKRRLSASPLLARARTLFEGLSGGVVGEDAGALPSSFVDAFLRTLDRDLETVLAEVGGGKNTR